MLTKIVICKILIIAASFRALTDGTMLRAGIVMQNLKHHPCSLTLHYDDILYHINMPVFALCSMIYLSLIPHSMPVAVISFPYSMCLEVENFLNEMRQRKL